MNDRVKRKSRTFFELVAASLLNLEVVPYWWSEIIQNMCYVLNRIPKSKNTTSFYKVLKNKKPNLSYFRT